MAYVITQPCIGVKEGACVAVCPVDCIHLGKDQRFIDPNVCIDCGACEPECPVEAIFEAEHVPEPWKRFVRKNADFFRKPRPAAHRGR
ncbi:MAG TPA: 4Fe-4S binding protein [Candidatus Polarisedimenticolia bacterium]|nr:4Fe-4S binding protein [Candidatus Polarisedimenticolia bacterium]